MAIVVELDFGVETGFYFRGKWPNQLLDAIAEKKEEIHKSLSANPLEPDMLMAERIFRVEGRDYLVTFGVDQKRASKNVFRVMYVECVAPSRKR